MTDYRIEEYNVGDILDASSTHIDQSVKTLSNKNYINQHRYCAKES